MLSQINNPLTFLFMFTSAGVGKTGLAGASEVKVDCRGTDFALIAGHNDVAATEIGGGLYRYTLPADHVTAQGWYTAVARTTDASVDMQYVPAAWYGVTSLLSIISYSPGGYFDDDLASLRWMLRVRLNDIMTGNYKDSELDYCLNLAKRETEILTRCHKLKSVIALVDGTATYDLGEIFEPLEIVLGTNNLDKMQLGDLGVSLEAWDKAAKGTPVNWAHTSGSNIKLNPPPNAAAVALGCYAYGFAVTDKFANDADRPTAIPEKFRIPAILTRAEAEARKMRPTHANNSQLAVALYEIWHGTWVEAIKSSIGG